MTRTIVTFRRRRKHGDSVEKVACEYTIGAREKVPDLRFFLLLFVLVVIVIVDKILLILKKRIIIDKNEVESSSFANATLFLFELREKRESMREDRLDSSSSSTTTTTRRATFEARRA